MVSELVHVVEAAGRVEVSPSTLRRWWREGCIDGEKDGRSLFISIESAREHSQAVLTAWRERRRRSRAREMVCLKCIVPGGCHRWDLRCLYKNFELEEQGD